MKKIYIFGSLAFDHLMVTDKSFSELFLTDRMNNMSISIHASKMTVRRGGTAGNIAYSLILLGERSNILSSVGNDFEEYTRFMIKHDLPLDGVRVYPEERTATCIIIMDNNQNQVSVYHPAATSLSCQPDLSDANPGDILIVSPGNIADMGVLPVAGKMRGMYVIYDPGQQAENIEPADLINGSANSDILIANEAELDSMCRRTGYSVEMLRDLTGTLIKTCGPKGVDINNGELILPGIHTNAIQDPTGAGDAFRAGLIKGIVMDADVYDAAKVGIIAATYSIEHLGTQDFYYTMDYFANRYQTTYDEPLPWLR